MPIYAQTEVKKFWDNLPDTSRSRTLAASKFAHLKGGVGREDDNNEYRKTFAEQVRKAKYHEILNKSHSTFASKIEEVGGIRLFAKLEARLLLNMAGGVIENGGICLDRNSGTAYIPGSAIKGAARRYAIWLLSQEDDLEKKSRLLTEISLIFGYGDQEWKSGRKKSDKHLHGGSSYSDFWLAMVPLEDVGNQQDETRDERWITVESMTKILITEALGTEKFPIQLSGSIAFLPAFPEKNPDIELDIITSHHPEYYKGKRFTATDDENPIPLPFPAISKGSTFIFPLLPCQSFASHEHLNQAEQHLLQALEIFGLGAKTNAGYGWFSIDKSAQARAKQDRLEIIAAKERQMRRASMSEEEIIAEDFKELEPAEFARVIGNLENEAPETQKVACQMLQGSEKAQWNKWKKQKKGKWVKRVPKIREIANNFNIELS